MADLVIAGHGHYSSGLLSGIEMIFGPQKSIGIIEFVEGETKTELDSKVEEVLSRYESSSGILVLCDVLQGSPFQSLAERAQRDNRVRIVFGANAPMVIECLVKTMSEDVPVDDLAACALDAGRQNIGLFDPCSLGEKYDDEDDWE